MNTSEKQLSKEFECHIDLPNDTCGAHQELWYDTEHGIFCSTCQVKLFANIGEDFEETMQAGEDSEDDDEDGNYVDEVSVSATEFEVKTQTPEQRLEISIMTALDEIKNKLRKSSEELQLLGQWVHENRFNLRQLYVILQTQHNFFPGRKVTLQKRAVILIDTYATFISQYEVPDSFYEIMTLDRKKISEDSERMYKEYTGKNESLVLFYIETYARQMEYEPQITDLAKDLWTSAEPIYVNAKENVRALVWLYLTHNKVTGKKVNRAAISRLTGIDSRTLKRVQDRYQSYFE